MSIKDRYDQVETKIDDVLDSVRASRFTTVIVALITLVVIALIVIF